MMITWYACVLRIIMRLFNGISGTNIQQYGEASDGDSSNTYKGESNPRPLSDYLDHLLNQLQLPLLVSQISIMLPSTLLVLSSVALGISGTAVDLHHHSPENPITLGFFGTPEIRDSINLKVKGKVNSAFMFVGAY